MKTKHRRYILKNIGKKSIEKIADDLGIEEKKLREFLIKEKYDLKIKETKGTADLDERTPIKAKRLSPIAYIALIFILGLAIYANSFPNEFVWDDEYLVVKNTVIRSFSDIPQVFKHHLTYFGSPWEGRFFRPIESIILMADYFFWKLNPVGYHITNALLHVLACSLFFCLLYLITNNSILSLIASLLYLVHPTDTESVTYISGRADSISSIFLFLIAIIQYYYWLSDTRKKRLFYYSLILLAFSLALLSKESAVIFPFLLMLYEYCVRNKESYAGLANKRFVFYLPFFILTGVWFLFKNKVIPTVVMMEEVLPFATRLAILPRLIYEYVKLSFFPINLHMEYMLFQKGYLASYIFIIPFLFLYYYVWKMGRRDASYRIMFFGLGWFAIGLFPYLSIIFPLNAIFAEHWLYIPEMGLILFVVHYIFHQFGKTAQLKRYIISLFAVIIAAYSCLTIKQNTVWKDGLTLLTHTVRHSPYSAKAYNNLAAEYIKKGDFMKAKELFEKSIQIDPKFTPASKNLEHLESILKEKNTNK